MIFNIKEANNMPSNNIQYNEHLFAWKEYMSKAISSIEQGNISDMEKYKSMGDNEYNLYKEDINNQIQNESLSFGYLNYIIENNLLNLFESSIKGGNEIKDYKKLIKEDNNLKSQYFLINSILNSINKLNESNENNENIQIDSNALREYLDECFSFVEQTIDRKSLLESNSKLLQFIKSNELYLNEDISDNLYNLFNDIDYIIKNKKSLDNLYERREHINSIINILKEENDKLIKEDKSIIKNDKHTFDDFYFKNKDNLTNEEFNLITSIATTNEGKEKAFNMFKEECYNNILHLISEAKNDEDKNELNSIKETIEKMEYKNDDSLFESLNKLLDIKEILEN